MTRDDAVKKAEACFRFNQPGQQWDFGPLRLVAALENLGLLKFDEPKTIAQVLSGIEIDVGSYDNVVCRATIHPFGAGKIIEELEAAGFQIIKK